MLLHASGFTSYPITNTDKHETSWLVLALRGLSCPSIEVIKEEACDRSKGITLLRCRSMQILYHRKCLCTRDVCFENHLGRSRLDTATRGVVHEVAICIQMTDSHNAELQSFSSSSQHINCCKCVTRNIISCLDSWMCAHEHLIGTGRFASPANRWFS